MGLHTVMWKVCVLALSSLGLIVADSELAADLLQVPLELGVPVVVPDLERGNTRCFVIRLPEYKEVRILASAVGLAGTPIIAGGWVPTVPDYATPRSGYHTLAWDGPRKSPQFYVCMRTDSEQGCDALLTVVAGNTSSTVPPIQLRPNYPSVWRLDGRPNGRSSPDSLWFTVQAEYLTNLRISAVPVEGEANMEIFDEMPRNPQFQMSGEVRCGPDLLLANSTLIGPDIVDLFAKLQKRQLGGMETSHSFCIKVTGNGVVAITASKSPGPFIAPFVPVAGRFHAMEAGAQPPCEFFQLLVNNRADVSVTATAEDNSQLSLSAWLPATESMEARQWEGHTPLGAIDGVLLVQAGDGALPDGQETCLTVSVCRKALGVRQERTRFWVTGTTDSGVLTLEDGLPATVPENKGQWRDFRFLVPGGGAKPAEVTISATSSGKVRLVADTARFPQAPDAYRWSSPNASHATLRLTTDPKLVSADVHLIDCRFPCFLFLSAKAEAAKPSGVAEFQLTATSDAGKEMNLLLEAQELEETLVAGESQVFRYRTLHNVSGAVLFSLDTHQGSATLTVSADPRFPDSPSMTSRAAKDVILLEPYSEIFRSAVARSKGKMPVLYLKVSSASTASFTLVARAEGDAKVMWNGDQANGAVQPGGYDRFRLFVGSAADLKKPVQVTIEVTPFTGQPAIYVACEPNRFPTSQHHDWGRLLEEGQGNVVFTSNSHRFRPGWVYFTLTSREKAAYKVQVSWGNTTVELQDGVEEMGHLMADDVRPFTIAVPSSSSTAPPPLVIRAEALVGAISLCVAELPGSAGAEKHVCRQLAVANASGHAELGLAAMDIEMLDVQKVGKLLLLVAGLHHVASDFALRVLASRPSLLAAERDLLVDSLGPPCCRPSAAPLLHRRYLHYLRLGSGQDLALELRALGLGSFKGATIKARESGSKLPWALVASAGEARESGELLKCSIDLRALLSKGGQQTMWLEFELEVQRPLNYTLHLQSSPSAPRAVETRLLPNVRVAADVSSVQSKKYEFDLGSGKETKGGWSLRMQECYGHVALSLPYKGLETTKFQEGSAEVPLPLPEKPSDAGTFMGSALVKSESEQPASYQVELLAPGQERSLLLPGGGLLAPRLGPEQTASFTFTPAKVGLLMGAKNTTLSYTLMAMAQDDPLLNANTSCGLEEARKRGELVTSVQKVVAANQVNLKQMHLMLPLYNLSTANQSLWVNLLVELIASDGHQVAARSYSSCNVTVAQVEQWKRDASASGGLLPIALVLLGAAALWFIASYLGGRCKTASESCSLAENDAMELEAHYDLHAGEYFGRNGYIPPST